MIVKLINEKIMNDKKKLFLGFLLLIVITIGQDMSAQKKETAKEPLAYLTTEQQLLLKQQQELLDKTKTILKENLTEAQLKIVNNRAISKEARTKLLRQSLSQRQQDIISSNRQLLKVKRTAFRNSLTKRQRFRLRRFLQRRGVDDRKRLARRLRRLIRDNIDR